MSKNWVSQWLNDMTQQGMESSKRINKNQKEKVMQIQQNDASVVNGLMREVRVQLHILLDTGKLDDEMAMNLSRLHDLAAVAHKEYRTALGLPSPQSVFDTYGEFLPSAFDDGGNLKKEMEL